jgi:chromosome segregation ATPase
METRNAELRTVARDDERRRRDEALAASLQQQVDELRNLVREQATRFQRTEELVRQLEGELKTARSALDEARQESMRQAQLRQLEEQRVRQHLAELITKVDEPLRPLRALQAQVVELIDQSRQQRDLAGQDARQFGDLRLQQESLRSEVGRAHDVVRQLRELLEAVQTAQAGFGREQQRLVDQARLIEQEVRRRITEAELKINGLVERIDAVAAFRPVFEENIRRLREEQSQFRPQVEELLGTDRAIEQQLARVGAQAEERDGLMRSRIEEIRAAQQAELTALREALHDTTTSIHEHNADWADGYRELNAQLSGLSVRVAALDQVDEHLAGLLRRTEERLVRLRLEQAQRAWEELMERREREDEE